jgi:hypothetical protein
MIRGRRCAAMVEAIQRPFRLFRCGPPPAPAAIGIGHQVKKTIPIITTPLAGRRRIISKLAQPKKLKGLNLIRPPPLWIWIAVVAVSLIVYLDTLAPR